MPDNIILGDGTFFIGETPIALTRGGGQFVVEREYREIEADGDYGPVKGRQRKTRSVARLTINILTILDSNLAQMYPATQYDELTGTWTGKSDIEDTDYVEVSWSGKKKNGDGVTITLQNAINLENIDWGLVDKEEVVPVVTYTAHYDESTRTTEPWEVVIAEEGA